MSKTQGSGAARPLFMPEGYDLTFGEMLPEVKDPLSHRGVAAKKLPDILQKIK